MSPQDMTLPVVRVADEAPELGLELYQEVNVLSTAMNAAPVTFQFVDGAGNIACGGGNGNAAADPEDVLAMIQATIAMARNRPDPSVGVNEALETLEEAEELSEFPQRMAAAAAIRWCRIFGTCD